MQPHDDPGVVACTVCPGKPTPIADAEVQHIVAGTCCKLCEHCPGFVSVSSSDYYTCYNCRHPGGVACGFCVETVCIVCFH